MNNILEITNDNFNGRVKNQKSPVIIDFWAPWCGPCKMLSPVIDELADDFKGKVIIGKVNVDQEAQLAQELKVMSIPTVMIFKEGKPIEKIVGFRQKEEFEKIIKNIL